MTAEQFNIVSILSGTNDLARVNTLESVCERLDQMYLKSFDHNAWLVYVTIPQSAFTDAEYVQLRTRINERRSDNFVRRMLQRQLLSVLKRSYRTFTMKKNISNTGMITFIWTLMGMIILPI